MRGEETRLSENSQDIEKVKQQHYIQEDKVWFYIFILMQFCFSKSISLKA